MSKPKIYVTRKLPERGLQRLKKHFNIEVWQDYGAAPKSVILRQAAKIDG